MAEFSDYIIFADECGDIGLRKPDPKFPVFGLAFVLLKKSAYTRVFAPSMLEFKHWYAGHESIILHGRDIRRRKGAFSLLTTDRWRTEFMSRLSKVLEATPFTIIAIVIRKDRLKARYLYPEGPENLALQFGLERVNRYLMMNGQKDKICHFVFESRGSRADDESRKILDDVIHGNARIGYRQADYSAIRYKPVYIEKKENSLGTQLADLVAYPITRHCLDPTQQNRAMEIIRPKIFQLKVFP